MYAVSDFNITNIVITLCLQKVVLVVGARCVMSFIYGFYGRFKHIPLMSNRLYSFAKPKLLGKPYLTFHKQNLAFSSALHVTALTKLFFSSPEHEVLMVSYCDQSLSVVRALSTFCFKRLLLQNG